MVRQQRVGQNREFRPPAILGQQHQVAQIIVVLKKVAAAGSTAGSRDEEAPASMGSILYFPVYPLCQP
jgi:hypothetical protein